MKIDLNVKDRLAIISILPTQGSITDLVEVMEIIKKIKFSEQEKQDLSFSEDNGKITWDMSLEKANSFDLSFEQVRLIKQTIDKLNEANKIDINILDTCLKFRSI